MGDGGPDVSGPAYVRDPETQCDVCDQKGCRPIDHNGLLSRENALRFAKVVYEGRTGGGRGRMLARWIIAELTGEDPGDPDEWTSRLGHQLGDKS